MSEFVTLLEKNCGHYGLVKDEYNQETIYCSQCELLKKENNTVQISKRKFVEKTQVPVLALNEMDSWIKEIISE